MLEYGVPFQKAKAFVTQVLSRPEELLAPRIFADLLQDYEVPFYELNRKFLEADGRWVIRKAKYAYCQFTDRVWCGRTLWWQSSLFHYKSCSPGEVLIGPIPIGYVVRCQAERITVHNLDVLAQAGNCRTYSSYQHIHVRLGWLCFSCHEYWRHNEERMKMAN